jgi:hypothetical protein
MDKDHASVLVEYQRGDADLSIRAKRGRSVFEVTNAQGFLMRTEVQDFIVQADDFIIDGLPSAPERSDRITDGDNIFEVMSFGGEPCFRYTDEYRQQMRIHTKKVGEQP